MREILGILKTKMRIQSMAWSVLCFVKYFLCTTTIEVEGKTGCSNRRSLLYNTSATHYGSQ